MWPENSCAHHHFFRNASGRNAGLRIDHLLLSPALVDAQVNMHMRDYEKTSDHALVWIELAGKAKRKRRKLAG